MRSRFISVTSAAAIALALSITSQPVLAQATNAQATRVSAGSSMPRTPDGHPDLQGTYDLATMTPFERFPGDPPYLTKEQAEKLKKAEIDRRTADKGKVDPNKRAEVGGDKTPGKTYFEILEKAGGGAVGGYDRLWLNQGSNFVMVDGQIRTSIVIDPPNGHVPPFNAAAKKRGANQFGLPTSDAGEDTNVSETARAAAVARGEYDNPEQRPLSERCLLGFGSTSGPPALPDYFYNDLHQIVQTPDSILIVSEMIHDARIVRMNAEHPQEHPALDGRFGGALGRGHAGDRHHEFHRQDPLSWLDGGSACGGTVEAFGCENAPVSVHHRRSQHLGSPVVGRNGLAGDQSADVRVRLPRRQLRARRCVARSPAAGDRSERGQDSTLRPGNSPMGASSDSRN